MSNSAAAAAYPKHLIEFTKKHLKQFLGYDDDGQLTNHLLNHSTKAALVEQLEAMLGANRAVSEFAAELWRRKTGEKDRQPPKLNASSQGNIVPATATQSQSFAAPSSAAAVAENLDLGRNVKVKFQPNKANTNAPRARMPCSCQATTHLLFTNCTACGKVVCEAEGEGPCFFCGSMVTQAKTFVRAEFESWMRSMEALVDTDIKTSGSEESKDASSSSTSSLKPTANSTAYAQGGTVSDSEALARAEAQRNKLLGFAGSEGKKGSQILDDQNDWYEFESNSWLSKEARAQKKAQAEQALLNLDKRKAHTLTIDLASKKVITHSSDAWKESLEPNANQPKWTDETAASEMAHQFAPDDERDHPSAHGYAMSKAMGGSKQLERTVDEMRIISQKQYFSNDTLTGRAKEVYKALQDNIRNASSANSASAAGISTSVPAVPKAENATALLKSLHTTLNHRDELFQADAGELEGLTDDMNELELEERLLQNRLKKGATVTTCTPKISCSMDEDEPTNCAGAIAEQRASVYSDESDTGTVLSMWQPWASLLVLGIKRFEGRGWFTPYRGRLWIASGSRETSPEEIEAVEAEYRQAYGPDAKIPFPKDYPTSALLGAVDLEHCWSQEEFQSYRSNHGAGSEDSSSAFVFVCTNPRLLPLPQRISGQHKLWNLPPKLYKTIAPNLIEVSQKWRLALKNNQAAANSTGFDIWPANGNKPLAGSFAKMPSIKATMNLIQPGYLHVKSMIPLNVQQELIDSIRSVGLLSEDRGFTVPMYEQGPQMNLKMLCLGKYWNLNRHAWEDRNAFGKSMHVIPPTLLKQVESIFEQVFHYLTTHGTSRDQVNSMFPHYVPDVCIVNYYSSSTGKLGVHQDKDETSESIKRGYPVISISIGDSAEFIYGNKRIPEEKLTMPGGVGGSAYSRVTLASGDVMLFGGPSRLLFHGIEKIHSNTKPRELFMKQGRLNLTFRKL